MEIIKRERATGWVPFTTQGNDYGGRREAVPGPLRKTYNQIQVGIIQFGALHFSPINKSGRGRWSLE